MAKIELLFPDYEHSNLNVTSALFHHFHKECLYKEDERVKEELKKGYKTIVYVLLDAFGVKIMEDNLASDSFLLNHISEQATCVYPSSTVPSTTAILTGKAPIESGWFGWHEYYKEYDAEIEPFTGKGYYDKQDYRSRGFDAEKIKPRRTLPELVGGVILYPDTITPGGYRGLDDFRDRILQCAEKKVPFVYAYCAEPDGTMHDYGSRSAQAKKICRALDMTMKQLYERINDDTLIIITADHGQRDVKYLALEDYPDFLATLKRLPTIEGRAASFFVKKGCKRKFVAKFNKNFADYFILYNRKQLTEKKLLGLFTPSAYFDEYIGDYFAVATTDYTLYSRPSASTHLLIGQHGGLTVDEMAVPIIILSKKKS